MSAALSSPVTLGRARFPDRDIVDVSEWAKATAKTREDWRKRLTDAERSEADAHLATLPDMPPAPEYVPPVVAPVAKPAPANGNYTATVTPAAKPNPDPNPVEVALSAIPQGDKAAAKALLQRLPKMTEGWKRLAVDSWLKAIAKHSGMMPRQCAGIYEKAQALGNPDSTSGFVPTEIILAHLERFNESHAVISLEGKARILTEPKHPGDMPQLASAYDFDILHATEWVTVEDHEGETEKKQLSKAWREWSGRRFYSGLAFEPNWDAERCVREAVYNVWKGLPVPGVAGDWSRLRDHVRDNICQGNAEHFAFLMTWMADIVQHIPKKKGCVAVVRGKEGTGKSKLFDWLRAGLGNYAGMHNDARRAFGQFNALDAGKLLIVYEEIGHAGDKTQAGKLKGDATSEEGVLEHKGINAVRMSNYARYALITNEKWAAPASMDGDRRWFVLTCGERNRVQTGAPDAAANVAYFAAIDDQMESGGLAAMVHDLATWDPATVGLTWNSLRTPPLTEALLEQRAQGMDPSEAFFVELVARGQIGAKLGETVKAAGESTVDVWTYPIGGGPADPERLRVFHDQYVREHGGQAGLKTYGKRHAFLANIETYLGSRVRHGHGVAKMDLPTLQAIREIHRGYGWLAEQDGGNAVAPDDRGDALAGALAEIAGLTGKLAAARVAGEHGLIVALGDALGAAKIRAWDLAHTPE